MRVRLVIFTAPFPAVLGPENVPQAQAVVSRRARRIAGDDDVVARVQRIASDTLLPKQAAGTPLYGPTLHHALVVLGRNREKRMGIAEHELHEIALNGHLLVFKVGG